MKKNYLMLFAVWQHWDLAPVIRVSLKLTTAPAAESSDVRRSDRGR